MFACQSAQVSIRTGFSVYIQTNQIDYGTAPSLPLPPHPLTYTRLIDGTKATWGGGGGWGERGNTE
jgi:hypothetical protein